MVSADLPKASAALLGNSAFLSQQHSPDQPAFRLRQALFKASSQPVPQLCEELARRAFLTGNDLDLFIVGKISSQLHTVRQIGVPGGIQATAAAEGEKFHGAFQPVAGVTGNGVPGGKPDGKGGQSLHPAVHRHLLHLQEKNAFAASFLRVIQHRAADFRFRSDQPLYRRYSRVPGVSIPKEAKRRCQQRQGGEQKLSEKELRTLWHKGPFFLFLRPSSGEIETCEP